MNAVLRVVAIFAVTFLAASAQSSDKAAKAEDPIVGTWIWPDSHRVTVRSDGTGESHKGPRMTWKFQNNKEVERKYRVVWDGGINIDAMIMTRDGRKMDGKRLDGTKFEVRRVEEDAR